MYRFNLGNRSNIARSSYLVFYPGQLTCCLACFKLISNCPPGVVGSHTQLILEIEIVHLYHHAIDLVRKLVALFFECIAIVNYCLDAPEYFLFFFWAPEAEVPKHFEGL